MKIVTALLAAVAAAFVVASASAAPTRTRSAHWTAQAVVGIQKELRATFPTDTCRKTKPTQIVCVITAIQMRDTFTLLSKTRFKSVVTSAAGTTSDTGKVPNSSWVAG